MGILTLKKMVQSLVVAITILSGSAWACSGVWPPCNQCAEEYKVKRYNGCIVEIGTESRARCANLAQNYYNQCMANCAGCDHP